jgi:hypothetical protein
VHGIPETRRVLAFAFSSRRNALCAAREAVRREVRPATWWCNTVLSAEMEGPESIVAAEARALEETARAAKGRAVAPSSRPRGRARHGSWTEILGARGAVSEMTLDGACVHGAQAPVLHLDAGLARRLDPRGVLLGRGA